MVVDARLGNRQTLRQVSVAEGAEAAGLQQLGGDFQDFLFSFGRGRIHNILPVTRPYLPVGQAVNHFSYQLDVCPGRRTR